MSDEEITNGERMHRWLMDREVLRELSEEERNAAVDEAFERIDIDLAGSDILRAELDETLSRRDELRRQLGK